LEHEFQTDIRLFLQGSEMAEGSRSNEDTKARLLEAAGEVFAQHGFRVSTVRQICKRARTNVGSVNYHFRDKKGLYAAVFGYALQLATNKYPPDLGITREATPEEKLRAYIHSLLLRLMAEGLPAWHGKLMAREMAEPSGALDDVLENSIRPLHTYLAGVVRELMHKEGSADREESHYTFLTSLSIAGQCLHYHIARQWIEALRPQSFDPTRIDRVADHITRFSLGGIRELRAGASSMENNPSEVSGGISSSVSIKSNSDPDLQAVIFDCDGILVDTEPLHYRAFQEVLVPLGLGHDFEVYLKRFVGFDDRDAFICAFREAGRELDPMTLERLIEAKASALGDFIRRGVPSFPGVIELIKELMERGVPMAVASGALRREVEAFIASTGLSGAFRIIVSADEVKKSKPDPETYLLAVERLRQALGSKLLDPINCIAIEDTRAGIRSAKSAGLAVIAVTNSFSVTELCEADKVIGSLSELSFQEIIKLLKQRRQVQQ
jgi:HAD superfamily hydrolase (TIGR01509 family)